MHPQVSKLLKGKRIEKACLLFIYISFFSCLAVYNKDQFINFQTSSVDNPESNFKVIFFQLL